MITKLIRRLGHRPPRLRLVKSGRDRGVPDATIERGRGPYESLILAHLHRESGAPISAILDAVAEEVLRDEQMRGGWISDIGVWGPSLIRRDVLATFEWMLGRSLILEGDPDGPWLVAPVAAS